MLGQTLYIKSFHPNEGQSQPRQLNDQIQFYQQPTLFDVTSQLQAKSVVNSDVLPQATAPAQQSVPAQKTSQQFVLTSRAVVDLLGNPKFKPNITVGKVLKIIKCLMDGKKNNASVAKQFNVDQSVVEQIEKYMIFTDQK